MRPTLGFGIQRRWRKDRLDGCQARRNLVRMSYDQIRFHLD